MLQVPYPTMERNFIVPPDELDLPESHNPNYQNNHHGYWPYKKMGELLITKMFRDLSFNQYDMPVDSHCVLHQRYAPPAHLPSLYDMVDVLEAAHDLYEPLKVQEGRKGPYFYQRISDVALKQAKLEYNRLNTNKRVA